MAMIVVGDPTDWGYLIGYLEQSDPRSAIQQFNDRQPGGWHKIEKFTFDEKSMTLFYPGDPPMRAISFMIFNDEQILLFPHSIVLVLRDNGTWEVARLD